MTNIGGPAFAIPHTLGTKSGGNLFHSFSQFDLDAGESATFSGPGDVTNILARVTGGSASSINGTIRSTIPGANFYLINPKGILFGPNAAIDISGAFTATSAAYVKLADGGRFDAANPAADLLTSAPIGSFGFLAAPAEVSFTNTQLTPQAGQAVAVVAGNIKMSKAKVTTGGGRVDLVSANRAGELPAQFSRLNREQTRTAGGAITMSLSTIDTSGAKSGAVVIRGGRLTVSGAGAGVQSRTTGAGKGDAVDVKVSGAVSMSSNSRIITDTNGAGIAGDVRVRAGALSMVQDPKIGSFATATTTSTARSGNVQVEANSIYLLDNAVLSTSTLGAGRGGALSVIAKTLKIRDKADTVPDEHSGILSNSLALSGGGAAGEVRVKADHIDIRFGGSIESDTFGTARGGDVHVQAKDIFISAEGSSRKTGLFADTDLLTSDGKGGKGGNIFVEADNLRITDGGLISTKTLGLGASGDTDVKVNTLEISRAGNAFFTGLAADTPIARGPGGDLRVTAHFIHIFDGGQISANTSIGDSIHPEFGHTGGPGGSVFVTADRIFMEGQSSNISAGSLAIDNGGDGGNVAVVVGDLLLRDGAQISASTSGQGAGGSVSVKADTAWIGNRETTLPTGIFAFTQSAAPGAGNGGTIMADFGKLTLTNNGTITASTFGTGLGGGVTVNARELIVNHSGQISADALGTGNGGDVSVTADLLRLDQEGIISASSSSAGAGGSVSVQAQELILDTLGSISASSTGKGVAGSVAVSVQEPFTLTGGANVSTTSDISDSGTVSISSGSDIFLDNGSVTVRATQGNAGRIELLAPRMISLTNATILAEAGLNGGDVFIDPQFVLLEHSRISANAILGAGGNIDIITNAFLASDGAVTASSVASVQGTVKIETVQGDISGALVTLSSSFVSPKTTLQERCAMRLGGDTSTFLVVGRGGVAPAPEESVPVVPITLRREPEGAGKRR